MRPIRAFSMLAGIFAALLFVPAQATADPCEGSHYEYDHGECYDKTGNTTDDMLHMYAGSDKLEQDMIDRSRPSGGSRGRERARLPESARTTMQAMGVAAVRALSFTPQATSPAIADFADRMPRDARPRARRLLSALLHDYREIARSEGFSPNVLSSGFFFSLVAAYRAYDGDGWSAPILAQGTWMGMTLNMTRVPAVANLSDAAMQHVADHVALAGGTLWYVAREAEVKHDRKARERVRVQARTFLKTTFGLDPQRSRLDDAYCLANAAMLTTSCDMTKFMLTQGRAGHNPFARF